MQVTSDATDALVDTLFSVAREVGRRQPADAVDRAAVAVLAAAADQGPARLSAIAATLGLDLSTVSRQAQALHGRGYLAKSADPGDHRARLVSATPAGRDLLATVHQQRVDRLHAALDRWAPGDREALARLLSRLAADLAGTRESR